MVSISIVGRADHLKEKLRRLGLTCSDKTWSGHFLLTEIERLKQFCRQYDLQYTIKVKDFKESRLPSGSRPLPNSKIPAVMGEGSFQKEVFNGALRRLYMLNNCEIDGVSPKSNTIKG